MLEDRGQSRCYPIVAKDYCVMAGMQTMSFQKVRDGRFRGVGIYMSFLHGYFSLQRPLIETGILASAILPCIIIQWVTAVTLRNTPRQAFGLLPWSCAQTTICGFAMQTVKTPNSECTVSHIGGKTRHMRGHILVSRLTDHQNMLPCCTKYLLLCPKAQQARHSHSRQHVGTVRPF